MYSTINTVPFATWWHPLDPNDRVNNKLQCTVSVAWRIHVLCMPHLNVCQNVYNNFKATDVALMFPEVLKEKELFGKPDLVLGGAHESYKSERTVVVAQCHNQSPMPLIHCHVAECCCAVILDIMVRGLQHRHQNGQGPMVHQLIPVGLCMCTPAYNTHNAIMAY